jgi:hypothetical protein
MPGRRKAGHKCSVGGSLQRAMSVPLTTHGEENTKEGERAKGRDIPNVAISWYLALNRNVSTEVCDLEQSIAVEQ